MIAMGAKPNVRKRVGDDGSFPEGFRMPTVRKFLERLHGRRPNAVEGRNRGSVELRWACHHLLGLAPPVWKCLGVPAGNDVDGFKRASTIQVLTRVRRHDGRYHWLEGNGHVDHAPDGTPLRFPGVLIDVATRRIDAALAALGERLRTLDTRVVDDLYPVCGRCGRPRAPGRWRGRDRRVQPGGRSGVAAPRTGHWIKVAVPFRPSSAGRLRR